MDCFTSGCSLTRRPQTQRRSVLVTKLVNWSSAVNNGRDLRRFLRTESRQQNDGRDLYRHGHHRVEWLSTSQLDVASRDCGQQLLGIFDCWGSKNTVGRGLLNNFATLHDQHVVSNLSNHSEIVGNE